MRSFDALLVVVDQPFARTLYKRILVGLNILILVV